MKKQLLLFASLFCCVISLHAQAIFNSNNYALLAGDSIISITFSDSITSPGPAGANQTWDFSFLQEKNRDTSVILDASTRPNSNLYPNATFSGGSILPDNPNTSADYFFGKDADSLTYYGANIQVDDGLGNTFTQTIVYSDPEIVFSFPMMYEDSVSDTFYGEYESGPGITSIRKGRNYVKYEGYGTLMMPNGATFTDVIRLKLVQIYKDSLTGQFSFDSNYESENVYFIGAGKKLPYLQYNKFTFNTPPNPPTTTHFLVSYPNTGAVGKDELLDPSLITLSPNPVHGRTELKIENTYSKNLKIEIFNIIGKKVKSVFDGRIQESIAKFSIETEDYLPGLYFIKVRLGEKQSLVKMQVR